MQTATWYEWLACGSVAAAAVLPGERSRKWAACVGLGGIAASWLPGSAREFLLPAAVGGLAVLALAGRGGRLGRCGRPAAIGGALLSVGLCWLFPQPEIRLQGRFGVGTTSFEIPAEGDAPRLLVQVWYPSDQSGGDSPWLADPELVPRFPFQRMAKARLPIGEGLPVATSSGKLKVVFYEHSWTGHRAENLGQVAEMVSHGLVVVAVDHPGQAGRVRYADGSVVTTGLPAEPDLTSEAKVGEFLALAEKCLAERGRNIERVLAALRGGRGGQVTAQAELRRVGVFGFSFGGSNALRLCARSPDFVAGANEDGLYLGDEAPRGPFHFFDSEMPGWLLGAPDPDETAEQGMIRKAEARVQKAMELPDRSRDVMNDVYHMGFSDAIFRSRLQRIAGTGRGIFRDLHEEMAWHLAVFFEEVLGEGGQRR
ncbi:hypothetical protein [Luteolibacter sp. Populi]|uniref:hypothetical protein n=1 Tax=Luteolibacter sp. Populi TaxID=3230487 RepID=UPI003466A52A